jgi:hypothetical protein
MAARVPARRGLMVSRVWLQVVGVVVLFGFLILGLLAHRTYVDEPSIPTQGAMPLSLLEESMVSAARRGPI